MREKGAGYKSETRKAASAQNRYSKPEERTKSSLRPVSRTAKTAASPERTENSTGSGINPEARKTAADKENTITTATGLFSRIAISIEKNAVGSSSINCMGLCSSWICVKIRQITYSRQKQPARNIRYRRNCKFLQGTTDSMNTETKSTASRVSSVATKRVILILEPDSTKCSNCLRFSSVITNPRRMIFSPCGITTRTGETDSIAIVLLRSLSSLWYTKLSRKNGVRKGNTNSWDDSSRPAACASSCRKALKFSLVSREDFSTVLCSVPRTTSTSVLLKFSIPSSGKEVNPRVTTELKNDEFESLYADEQKPAGEEVISGEEFVNECTVESDLELLFPNEYIPSSSERMLLYRELDKLELDRDVDAFKARLTDRFGKIPPEGEELIRIVPLRRLARRLGVERVFLKGGRMILYFVSNLDSPYYQSQSFGKVIDYMAKYPRNCNLRENNGKRSMIVKEIPDVETAVRVLQEIVSLG